MKEDDKSDDDKRPRRAAEIRARAAAFLDLWERHVSERALRGPGRDEGGARTDEP